MNHPVYIGIDDNEWIVALLSKDAVVYSKPFKNTPADIGDLVRFITEHRYKPKICLKPGSRAALELIKFIVYIPDVEVVLISHAGLKMHQAWLANVVTSTPDSLAARSSQAQLLAYCAQRIS